HRPRGRGGRPADRVAEPVRLAHEPVVRPGHLAGRLLQEPRFEAFAGPFKVEREPGEEGRRALEGRAVVAWKELEAVAVVETDIEMQLRALVVRVHHVPGADGGAMEPANVARAPPAREHGVPA